MAEPAQVRLDRARFIWESRQILHWLLPCICWLTTYLIMAAPFGGQKGVAAVSLVSTCSGLMVTPTWWFTRPTWPRWLAATPHPPPAAVPHELQVSLLTRHFEVIIVCICRMQCYGICTKISWTAVTLAICCMHCRPSALLGTLPSCPALYMEQQQLRWCSLNVWVQAPAATC